MNSPALSPWPSAASDDLKLSDGQSVRWFVEALELFRRFDQTSSKDILRDARSVLRKCVRTYPQDLLPGFYLAIAESILGDMDQDEAIAAFEKFARSGKFEVRTAAQYNLAASYVETYDPALLAKAETLLDTLIADLSKEGAKIGMPPWAKALRDWLLSPRTRVEQLYYQALETRAYVRIHLEIWTPRWTATDPESLEGLATERLNELEERAKALDKHKRFLGEQGPEIRAWHWNNIGSIEEARSVQELRSGNEANAMGLAAKAASAYERALQEDSRFSSAKANLGRLHFEVTGKLDEAARLFLETLTGAEDTEYTYYNLGLVRTLQGLRNEAISAFLKAPAMLKRKGQIATWAGARKMLIADLRKRGRDQRALGILRDLARDHPGDAEVKQQIAELTSPSSKS